MISTPGTHAAALAKLAPPLPPADVDRLADQIAEVASLIDAAEHRLLTLIRRFDEGAGWATHGALSCAHWLNLPGGDRAHDHAPGGRLGACGQRPRPPGVRVRPVTAMHKGHEGGAMQTTKERAAIPSREGDGYFASCRELEIARQGTSAEEARRDLGEAVDLFFAAADAGEVRGRW